MGDPFSFPFDLALLTKRKKLRRSLLEQDIDFIDKRIAILGGSTTHDIRDALELFLLRHGIRAEFYESEYAQYWQDAMFPNAALEAFRPDIIYIHTGIRNIPRWPGLADGPEAVEALLNETCAHFETMWRRLEAAYGCPIIQNNFEYPYWRLQGNREASDIHGRVNFVTRLNLLFADWARSHGNFYINDINYLSAYYGLSRWSDPFYWHMYKYALALPAVPYLAHSVANIIKSVYGRNKKAFALDLDNTLWGGIVGDDGAENLEIGQETPVGQAYSEFQEYLKAHKQLGVILNIVSKNEAENALSGLRRPDMTLKEDDFIMIKANWEPKSQNLADIAHTLSLTPDSFVFVDDNPAEREIIRQQVRGAAVPEIGDKPENYIAAIDRMGYFEVTALSSDDAARTEMYRQNAARSRAETAFSDYGEYLRSLDMEAEIAPFAPMYCSRIAQLTNKSNQFNLTTRRCTQAEIEAMAGDKRYITLYGKLRDKFGDNGVVSVAAGEVIGGRLDIILWLMSCRVLKRDMEYAMMDELVRRARALGLESLRGYYYPTAKNGMVRDFYAAQGFQKLSEDADGNTVWELDIRRDLPKKNTVIKICGDKKETER
ncbi:MAG: HAD family hydrolase [Oscillospiraceae bacterium]|nr:HAD family hydrolase [Oscillospiraceae bacterium]